VPRQLWYIIAATAGAAVVMIVLLYVLSLFGSPPALERSPGPGASPTARLPPPERLEQPHQRRLARLGEFGSQPVALGPKVSRHRRVPLAPLGRY
jgi:hypothetical protein